MSLIKTIVGYIYMCQNRHLNALPLFKKEKKKDYNELAKGIVGKKVEDNQI